ncbi:hypothetical protein RNN12_23585, partial [Escherichia coli]|uniref:hypothetical protein n=1 Tax=Escherichia coli TaxID=562 RepID=UPI00280B8BE2
WLQPCLLKIYSHMVTFWGNYEGISQYFAPYRWLRFTGAINEKSRVSRRRRGLTGEMNKVYCLRGLSLASHALSGFPVTMAGAVFTFDINNVQRNAWFTP